MLWHAPLRAGQTVLIPAAAGDVELEPDGSCRDARHLPAGLTEPVELATAALPAARPPIVESPILPHPIGRQRRFPHLG